MDSQVLALLKRSLFTKMIESHFKDVLGLVPVIKETIEDLQMFLELLGGAELVIIDGTTFEQSIDGFILCLHQKKIVVNNILIIGKINHNIDHPRLYMSEKPEVILDIFRKMFKVNPENLAEYMSIPVESLVHFKFLPFDLYIKLSEEKYIKRFHSSASIDKQSLNILKLKGVNELYFDKMHNREFSILLLNNMMNGVDREYVSFGEKLEVANDVFLTAKEIIQSMGFPIRIIKVCESVMKCIKDDVFNGKNQFSSYLEQLKKPEYSFHYRYIELTSYFATQIIDDLEVFASSNYSRLIIFSALFCDVTLKEPNSIHIRSNEQLIKMSETSLKDINQHALKAAAMVQDYHQAPQGADKIIRQHHGTLNGIGFSENYYDMIGPLSKCLIVSQTLAYEILSKPDIPIKKSVDDIVTKFNGSPLEEIIVKFEKQCNFT